MYEILPYILGIAFILLGGFMIIFPQKAVKKEFQNSEKDIKKARQRGILLIICGIVLVILGIVQPK